jgi:hypothetical protein
LINESNCSAGTNITYFEIKWFFREKEDVGGFDISVSYL